MDILNVVLGFGFIAGVMLNFIGYFGKTRDTPSFIIVKVFGTIVGSGLLWAITVYMLANGYFEVAK